MPRIRLQARDLEMLTSLGIARYLTVQALDWLHVPTWRTRWERYQTEQRDYAPIGNLYRRLEALREAGYIVRLTRTAERAAVSFRRLPDVYTLTKAGADLVGRDDLVTDGQKPRSLVNLEHTVMTAQLYAALCAELAYFYRDRSTALQLDGWQDDRRLAAHADRVPIAGQQQPRTLIPDATFRLFQGDRARRYFVETDMGTRSLDTWRLKAQSYTAYQGSTLLHSRYGVGEFVLLITAPTERRLERIAGMVAESAPRLVEMTRYIMHSMIHPATVRTWEEVGQVQRDQVLRFGQVQRVTTVQLQPSLLWKVGGK